MEKVLEKQLRRYVIAYIGQDGQARYLGRKKQLWFITPDITQAAKTRNRALAQDLLSYYRQEVTKDIELAVIPLEITYELIKEVEV